MNDTLMTIVGNLVDDPSIRETSGGHHVANFRIASTPRYCDRATGRWADGKTLYVTVTAWRALADNVKASLSKGQPVVVMGKYYQRDYERDEQLRTAYELEAVAVGHDLTRGVSSFERKRQAPAAEVERDADGVPADVTDRYLVLADGQLDTVVDTVTGEVVGLDTGDARELATVG